MGTRCMVSTVWVLRLQCCMCLDGEELEGLGSARNPELLGGDAPFLLLVGNIREFAVWEWGITEL